MTEEEELEVARFRASDGSLLLRAAEAPWHGPFADAASDRFFVDPTGKRHNVVAERRAETWERVFVLEGESPPMMVIQVGFAEPEKKP